jgi:hypothetical protein
LNLKNISMNCLLLKKDFVEYNCNLSIISHRRNFKVKNWKKGISLILLYVLSLSLLPLGLFGHAVEAASTSLKKIKLDNPYYVMEAVQYNDKTFIVGGELAKDPANQEVGIVVRTGGSTKAIVPASEIKKRYTRVIGETENKWYIEAIDLKSEDPSASDVYIVDKNTEQYEKQTLEEFYAPFLQQINADKSSIYDYYRSVYISNDDTIWVVLEKETDYNENNEEIPGKVFIVNNHNFKKEIPYQRFEGNGEYKNPISAMSIDQKGNFYYVDKTESKLIKIQDNGTEASYVIPKGHEFYDFSIDSAGNFYMNYKDEQDNYYVGVFQISNGQLTVIKNLDDIESWTVDNKGTIWAQKCADDTECDTATLGYVDSNFNFHGLYIVEYGHPYAYGYSIYNDIVLAYSTNGYGLSTNATEIRAGWVKEGGKWYYIDEKGAKKKGWLKIDGKWYHLDINTGAMQTGWIKDRGKWYYLDSNGVMKTGWLKVGSKWYYLDSNGVMKTGWVQIGAKWYYFDGSGVMKTGWLKVSSKWYYFNPSGDMVVGWKKINNKWYYFYSNGSMAANTTIQGYKLGKDGAMIP